MRTKLPPFDPAWIALSYSFAPSEGDAWAMVKEVRALFPRDSDAAAAMGVPWRSWMLWKSGRCLSTYSVRALIFTRWALLCHPEKIQSAFDLVTWGRFRTLEKRLPVKVRTAGFTDGDGI